MDEYVLTILKDKNLLDEITFFTDDPIDAFKRMNDTYLEYNLTHKGTYTYTIILSLYVENGKKCRISQINKAY